MGFKYASESWGVIKITFKKMKHPFLLFHFMGEGILFGSLIV